MEKSVLCCLPHYPNGLPKGSSLSRCLDASRMSHVWAGQLDGSLRDVLVDLSARATAAGVCPNHVYLMRYQLARIFVGER